MTHDTDDAIDALLRKQFGGPVPDDGFCDRVMAELPARPRRTAWPLVWGVLAGVVACGWSLWAAPVVRAGWTAWLSGQASPSAIALLVAMACMAMLAAAWALAESDDRAGTPRR